MDSYMFSTRDPTDNKTFYALVLGDTPFVVGKEPRPNDTADIVRHIKCTHSVLMRLGYKGVLPSDVLAHIFRFVADVHPFTTQEAAWYSTMPQQMYAVVWDKSGCEDFMESMPVTLKASRSSAAVLVHGFSTMLSLFRNSDDRAGVTQTEEWLAWVLDHFPDQMLHDMTFWEDVAAAMTQHRPKLSDWSVYEILAVVPEKLRSSVPLLRMLIDAGCHTQRSIVDTKNLFVQNDVLCPQTVREDIDFVVYFDQKMTELHCLTHPVWATALELQLNRMPLGVHKGSDQVIVPAKLDDRYRTLFDSSRFRRHAILNHTQSLLSLMSFSNGTRLGVSDAGQWLEQDPDPYFVDSRFVQNRMRILDYEEAIDTALQSAHESPTGTADRVPRVVCALPDAVLREFSTDTWLRVIQAYPALSRKIPADATADMVLLSKHFPCSGSTRSMRFQHQQTKRSRRQPMRNCRAKRRRLE